MFKDTIAYDFCERVIKINQREVFKKALDNNVIKDLIIFLNTQKQMYDESIDSEGNPLYSKRHDSGVYSERTEILSNGLKIAGTPYTLMDEGDFFDSFVVELKNYYIEINANPKKGVSNLFEEYETDLFEEYGEDIVGLTDDNLQLLIEKAKELFLIYYEEQLIPR